MHHCSVVWTPVFFKIFSFVFFFRKKMRRDFSWKFSWSAIILYRLDYVLTVLVNGYFFYLFFFYNIALLQCYSCFTILQNVFYCVLQKKKKTHRDLLHWWTITLSKVSFRSFHRGEDQWMAKIVHYCKHAHSITFH